MGIISNSNYEKYLVYPNESIDKLTVNRTFERLFEDIDAKTSSTSLTLETATENSYGKAKFSSLKEYSFEEPSESTDRDEYEDSMLTIGQLKDMSDRMADGSYNAVCVAPVSGSLPMRDNLFWVRSKYMDSKFLYMPNGINVVSCSFELGFNGISKELSAEDAATEDIVTPVTLSSYTNQIYVDQESKFNVEDYMHDNHAIDGSHSFEIPNILNMDGRRMGIPFVTDAKVTLRHNDCGCSKYFAYRQSYIELCMSLKIGLKSLYDLKYGHREYELIDDDSNIVDSESKEHVDGEMKRKYRLFTQPPMVMAQIGFYNNDSVPRPLFGFDDVLSGGDTSEFSSYNSLSQKELDESIVDGIPISPVDGCVFVKNIENEYDQDGNIVDNVVCLDVVMKFMGGSAADPELEYAMNTFNSRSKVQFVMIGV
jgi:hypothetical protein